jgi:glycosyltransferase involved in cell wall biosynthesis
MSRICMIAPVPFPPKEGLGKYVHGLAQGLAELGHEVMIVARGNGHHETLTLGKVVCHKVPFFRAYPLHIQLHGMFVDLVTSKLGAMDIYHLHNPLVPVPQTSTPIITTFQTIAVSNALSQRTGFLKGIPRSLYLPVAKNLERRAIDSSACIAAVSEGTGRDLWAEYNIGKVRIMPNAVDTSIYRPCLEVRRSARFPYLLYTGYFSRRKGVDDLIRAMGIVGNHLPELHLVMAGNGPMLPKLISMVRHLKLEERVHFPGILWGEELVHLYQGAEMFVFPSYYEGMSTSVIEAMSTGLPLVATRVKGIAEIVNEEWNGALVDAGDSEALADRVLDLMTSPSLRRRLGMRARQYAEQMHDWKMVSAQAEEIYTRISARLSGEK